MLPNNSLSSYPLPSTLLGGRSLVSGLKVDYESGPISINDPSHGLQYQIWQGVVDSINGIYIGAETVPMSLQIPLDNISEFSFTFDQNGNLAIVYIQYSRTYLWWFDTTENQMVTTYLGNTIISPKIALDDKRRQSSATNDIIVGYIKNNNLYYIQQRDRFGVEYLLKTNVSGRIDRMGLGVNLRFQFHIRRG